MSEYNMETVHKLWNAGYDLGQIVKARKSYKESMHYLSQLNYYRENNYQRFKEYLLNVYIELDLTIPETLSTLIQSETEAYKYSVVFCMGYIGSDKIKIEA